MTTQEMIAILKAYEEGRRIQRNYKGSEGWDEVSLEGRWDFFNYNYRIAQSPIAPGHNPLKLTEEQVGVSEGWRLLERAEIIKYNILITYDIEMYEHKCWMGPTCGVLLSCCYRTKRPPGYFLPKLKRVPLGPQDFPPNTLIRWMGSPFWSLVLGVYCGGIDFVWDRDEEMHKLYTHLIDVYERSLDGGKTWLPCYKEIEE